ncbi:uncharacterized protein KIAA2012 homolog [Tautogolabrus adspersus]
MKDLSLSLLSRGCCRVISSNTNAGRHDGRLEVCFTPEDYFIWKSRDSLLRMSESGRLFGDAESNLPKTYSTRRGPLLLYSQDFVTLETGLQSEMREKQKKVVQRYKQEVEQQLSTLRELTAAILNYGNNQFNFSKIGPLFFPPLHVPITPDLRPPSPSPTCTTSEQPSPDLLARLNSQLGFSHVPSERNTEQTTNQPEDKEEEHSSRKRVRLDLFLQVPCTTRTPSPLMEPQPWVHYVAMIPQEPLLRREGPRRDERHTQLLPPITESRTGTPDSPTKVQTQHDVQQRSKRVGYQSRDNLKRLHQQPLIFPQLVHGELSVKKKSGGGEISQRDLRRETVWQGRGGGGGGGGLPSERGSVILLAPGEGGSEQNTHVPDKHVQLHQMIGVKGKRGEEQKNEEREGRGEGVRRSQESAGKRRRRMLKDKDLLLGSPEDSLENQEAKINLEMKEESHPASPTTPSAAQKHRNRTNSEGDAAGTDHLYTNVDKHGSFRSVSSLRSTAAASQSNLKSSRRSVASSCEGAGPASALGLTSSHGRLSSCSTVMVTEEQLMLNLIKPEPSKPRKSQREEEEEAAALHLAQRAEKRRQDVERKRREREEEARRQQDREQTEDRMKSELEEERRRRAEELRLKRMAEEEKRRKQEEEEQVRVRREQEQRERERRRQEEKMRQMERLQKMREEEEQRRRAELERLLLEEETRQEEENRKLQEMDESERVEYLRRKELEEEERRKNEEERRRREEEAALQAAEAAKLQDELLARQMALLQQLAFKRGLTSEAGGLEKTQGISRPWVYSYFTLLQLLGLNPS